MNLDERRVQAAYDAMLYCNEHDRALQTVEGVEPYEGMLLVTGWLGGDMTRCYHTVEMDDDVLDEDAIAEWTAEDRAYWREYEADWESRHGKY